MPIEFVITFDILPGLETLLEDRAFEIVHDTAKAIKRTARRKILDPPKTGRIYTSGPEPLPHQASAPGESPANWTGALQKSIRFTTRRTGPGQAEALVVVGEEHGFFLEFGTVHIAARPFMGPTVAEIAPSFFSTMNHITDAAFARYMAELSQMGAGEEGDL